jgi:hypothetical protein
MARKQNNISPKRKPKTSAAAPSKTKSVAKKTRAPRAVKAQASAVETALIMVLTKLAEAIDDARHIGRAYSVATYGKQTMEDTHISVYNRQGNGTDTAHHLDA